MHKLHRNKPSTSVHAHTRACMQAYTHTDAHACKRTHAHKPACKRVIQTYTRICTICIETKSTNSTNTACTVRSICTYGERMYMTLKCSVRSARMAQAHPFLRCYMHPQRIPAFWENTCPEKTRKDRVSLATPKKTPVLAIKRRARRALRSDLLVHSSRVLALSRQTRCFLLFELLSPP